MASDLVLIPDRSLTGFPTIQFSGCSGTSLITLQVLQDGSISIMGSQGQLFGVSDSLVGSLQSVTDIAGLPIFEVFSDDRIVMGTFNANAVVVSGRRLGVGTASPLYTLDVTGLSRFAGGLIANGISLYPAFTGDFSQTSGAASFSALKLVSGVLAATISASAAGVSTFNGLSGALNLSTAPAPANYVTFSTSGNTFWLSGLANPTFTSATFAKDSAATTNATALWTNAAGTISYADAGIDTSNNLVLRTRATGAGALTVALTIASGTQLITAAGAINAQTYQVATSGAATPLMGAGSGTYTVNVGASPGMQSITITGGTLFTGTNYVAGGATSLRIIGGAANCGFAFATPWRWVSSVPSGIASGKLGRLTIESWTTAESGVIAAYSAELF